MAKFLLCYWSLDGFDPCALKYAILRLFMPGLPDQVGGAPSSQPVRFNWLTSGFTPAIRCWMDRTYYVTEVNSSKLGVCYTPYGKPRHFIEPTSGVLHIVLPALVALNPQHPDVTLTGCTHVEGDNIRSGYGLRMIFPSHPDFQYHLACVQEASKESNTIVVDYRSSYRLWNTSSEGDGPYREVPYGYDTGA